MLGTDSLERRELYMPSQTTVSAALAARSAPSGVRYSAPVTAPPSLSHHSLPLAAGTSYDQIRALTFGLC